MKVKLKYEVDGKLFEDVKEYGALGVDLLDRAVTKRLIELTNASYEEIEDTASPVEEGQRRSWIDGSGGFEVIEAVGNRAVLRKADGSTTHEYRDQVYTYSVELKAQ